MATRRRLAVPVSMAVLAAAVVVGLLAFVLGRPPDAFGGFGDEIGAVGRVGDSIAFGIGLPSHDVDIRGASIDVDRSSPPASAALFTCQARSDIGPIGVVDAEEILDYCAVVEPASGSHLEHHSKDESERDYLVLVVTAFSRHRRDPGREGHDEGAPVASHGAPWTTRDHRGDVVSEAFAG